MMNLVHLGETRPVHAIPGYVFKIHFNDSFHSMTGSFKQVPPTKILYASPFYPMHVTCPTNHNTSSDHPTNSYTCKLWISSLCHFLHPPISPITFSLFGPNTFYNTQISNTLILCSPLNVRDQVSHSYKTGEILVLHNNLYILRQKMGKQNILN